MFAFTVDGRLETNRRSSPSVMEDDKWSREDTSWETKADRYLSKGLPDKPIQLVRPGSDHKTLEIIEENLKYLHDIPSPVAVVAVVGNFHSGKSFLMNQLMSKDTGFGVGPSVQPKTMGIWCWGRPATMHVKTETFSGKVNVLFIDTEGFAANNVSENYDAKVFAVATLLSSHLLFNSVKIINQADIDYLEVLARKTQLFALRSQMSKSMWIKDFNHDLLVFPPLTWIIQDFAQELKDIDDNHVADPREWLHQLMKTHVRETESYKISILDIFKEVDAHTLFIPATRKDLLTDLSKAQEEDLTLEYREERDDLIKKLRKSIQPKKREDKFISGSELAHLLRILVVAANEGSMTQVPSRWEAFVDHLQSSATDDCLKFFEDEMQRIITASGHDGVMKKSSFHSLYQHTSKQSEELMRHLLHGLETLDTALLKLSNRIDAVFERLRTLNEDKIQLKLNDIHQSYAIKAKEMLSQMKTPLPSKVFEDHVHKSLLPTLEDKLFSLSSRLLEDKETLDFVATVMKSLRDHVDNFRGRNQIAISKFFETVATNSVNEFVEIIKRDWSQQSPMKPVLLEKLQAQGIKEVLHTFEVQTKDFADESIADAMKSHLKQQLKEKCDALEENNSRLASEFIQQHSESMLQLLKSRTGPEAIQMPVFDNDLNKKLEDSVNEVIKKFEVSTLDYSVYSCFQPLFQQFKKDVHSLCDLRRRENIDAFTREVTQPLEASLRVILLSETNYRSVFSFKQFIRSVCLINLDDGKPKSWPIELKMQIIDNFIQSKQELKTLIEKKDGLWSTFMGFIEWILWSLGLID